jgi:ABC-type multidrug transport system ATPase subunit
MSPEFQHQQAAHCESGVISNLLKNIDVPLSEAMSFGIGSGLFFIHLPFVKVMELPLTSYRSFPGTIFKKTCRRLHIPYEFHTFRNQLKGERALDDFLAQKQAVGIRSNIFWLPYIPKQFRFQFNAHNLVVSRKNDDDTYEVSDPILEEKSTCSAHAMSKARFAKGVLAPKGLIFFPKRPETPIEARLEKAVRQGIRETTQRMLFSPLPFAGVRGIRYLSRRMARWPQKFPELDQRKLQMANVVRMQEEIGTGGAGFRYLYAAFLQEAGTRLNNEALKAAALRMSEIGDVWREFATLAARSAKTASTPPSKKSPRPWPASRIWKNPSTRICGGTISKTVSSTDAVNLQKLVVSYKGAARNALDGLDLRIPRGRFFGLLGPNGAGKTTLISFLCGQIEGKYQSASILGTDRENITTYKRKLGYAPQEVALYPTLSAEDNLIFFARLQGAPLAEVDRVLQWVDLNDRRKTAVKEFSGGMKRRLNLAVALLNKPELLILDEPTVGIDPQSRNFIFEKILELKKQNVTLIYSTHYLQEVKRLCDDVGVLQEGKMLATGTLDEVFGDGDLEKRYLELTKDSAE